MEPQALWIIALSIATPVAGVVGFAIQLREVKKGHFENEKLQLEIEALKTKAAAADKRIVQVTTEEVKKYTALASLSGSASNDFPRVASRIPLKEIAINGLFILTLLLFAAYFLYDIYRLIVWLSTKL